MSSRWIRSFSDSLRFVSLFSAAAIRLRPFGSRDIHGQHSFSSPPNGWWLLLPSPTIRDALSSGSVSHFSGCRFISSGDESGEKTFELHGVGEAFLWGPLQSRDQRPNECANQRIPSASGGLGNHHARRLR